MYATAARRSYPTASKRRYADADDSLTATVTLECRDGLDEITATLQALRAKVAEGRPLHSVRRE